MKNIIRRAYILVFILAGLSVVLFQNCSQKNFEAQVYGSDHSLASISPPAPPPFACAQPVSSCEKNGQIGTMNCDNGVWGPCIVPEVSTTTTTIKSSDPTISVTTTTTVPPTDSTLPKTCSFKGRTYQNGESFIAYDSEQGTAENNCLPRTRTCMNGVISGSAQYFSCTPKSGNPSASCSFAGQTIAHGSTVRVYSSSSVPAGQSCEWQDRYCNNGVLDGSYSYASCSPQIPPPSNPTTNANCSFNGKTIAHGSAVTAYQYGEVSKPATCQKQSRVCQNGVLTGSYQYESCQEKDPAGCSRNIIWGQGTTRYGASCQLCIAPGGNQYPSDAKGYIKHGTSVSLTRYAANNGLAESFGSYSGTCVNGSWQGSGSCDATCGNDEYGNPKTNCTIRPGAYYNDFCVPY